MELNKHRAGGSKGGNAYGTYQVRYASEKQINFIKKLLTQKQHSVDVDLSTLNVQGAGDLITNLLLLPDKVDFVDYATEKQVGFARSLIEAKESGFEILNATLQRTGIQSLEKLSKKDVSQLIGELRLTKDKEPTITEVGAYLYEGVVYSIRKSQSTDRLVIYTYDEVAKKYLANATATKKLLNKIEPQHRLTLEEAIKYSAHTGLCCHCGRNLYVLKSVAGGIGPICAKYYQSIGKRAERV